MASGHASRLGPGARRLAAVEAFASLSPAEHDELERQLQVMAIARGQALMRQGERADALYLVVSGRFKVLREGRPEAVAEIGVGSPIGEIAFFAGGERTATVIAERDSLVLELKRADFDRLAERSPAIWRTITSALARRLAATTEGPGRRGPAVPRTIAVCRAGGGALEEEFLARFSALFDATAQAIVLDAAAARNQFGGEASLESSAATQWFNELEGRYDHVVYIADDELTPWSKKALRQADLVLCVGRPGPGRASDPNLLELFAERLAAPGSMRLVLLHEDQGAISGSSAWLERRPWIGLHHHLGLTCAADYERLLRFLQGRAVGLVACGGGAYSAAHIGLFEALAEVGLDFDIMGGASGGAAMTAARALAVPFDEMERAVHDIFVTRKAMRRWTWPRYSLLDHTELERALEEHFAGIDIEDLSRPWFALSTNLTRAASHPILRGPLWSAIRASSAIPALLPPVFTGEGEMLVDGCLIENVPLATMQGLKAGPNVVLDLTYPATERVRLEHGALPSRWRLLWALLTGGAAVPLPDAPRPHAVLMRSMMLSSRDYSGAIGSEDLVLNLPLPDGIGHLDWHRHGELRAKARDYARVELARLAKTGHPLLR